LFTAPDDSDLAAFCFAKLADADAFCARWYFAMAQPSLPQRRAQESLARITRCVAEELLMLSGFMLAGFVLAGS
jgi:hypothetical protein